MTRSDSGFPPGREVVPLGGLLFVSGWFVFWAVALAYYLFVPSDHGAVFTVLCFAMCTFGLYFSSMVFFPAAVARFAVETLTLGPEGFTREVRLGPLAFTRRVDLDWRAPSGWIPSPAACRAGPRDAGPPT